MFNIKKPQLNWIKLNGLLQYTWVNFKFLRSCGFKAFAQKISKGGH